MQFLLGTNEPTWLGRSPVPLFVSLSRRDRFRKRPLAHEPGWALDSGGFTQITERGGWTMPPEEYLAQVYELDDLHGGMMWAAPQDWMCEPIATQATGLTVAEHQRRTVENFCQLREIDERKLIIPVLQGFLPGEHEHCVKLYEEAGVDLTQYLVGVGTICRRQGTAEIRHIVEALSWRGIRMHGFGIKITGLQEYGDLLESCDSMAWAYRARMASHHDGKLLCGDPNAKHKSCSTCYVWAHQWRDRVALSGIGSRAWLSPQLPFSS